MYIYASMLTLQKKKKKLFPFLKKNKNSREIFHFQPHFATLSPRLLESWKKKINIIFIFIKKHVLIFLLFSTS